MDSEHEDSAADARETSVASAGAQLRAAREALRLELAQIAAETRIPLRHLEAIEVDDFESLPSRAYAIGFSRTYAKAVGLDDAAITDAVRAELADGSMRRTLPSPGMEPGDPARLPSAGLAWAGAFAALVLAIGAFAFYNSYFGAGTEPGPLATPEPAASAPPPAAAASSEPAAEASGPVVLTSLDDGVWVRLYEEGGERLVERTLQQGESIEVPATARDPRINTGRPDALALTVGGQPVAKLAERAQTISGVKVSAAALIARGEPTAAASPQASAPAPMQNAAIRRNLSARQPAAEPAATAEPASAAIAEQAEAASEPAPRP